jgi:hypothetical protein
MKRGRGRGVCLPVLCLVFAASATPVAGAESPPEVPSSVVVEVRRQVLAMEGLPAGSMVYVISHTRPIYSLFALRRKFCTEPLDQKVALRIDADEKRLEAEFAPIPVDISATTASGQVGITGVRSFSEIPARALTLEFSSPLVNPYLPPEGQELGLFARFSMEGFGGTWYWVQVLPQHASWHAIQVIKLDVEE